MPMYVRGSGKEIPFGDFSPDKDPASPGIVLDANNATPTMKGFAARNQPVTLPNGLLPNTVAGAYMGIASTIPTLFAGVPNALFKMTVGGWTLVSPFLVSTFTRWRFTQFGTDIIATNSGANPPQVWTPGTNFFNPLGGSPPVGAGLVISVGGFVVFFSGPNWYSSAAGVDNNYVPNIQTLAATGTLYDIPGDITAAAALYRSIVAFKAGATWVGTFSGAPFTWSFQLISGEVGTYGQECVVTLPDSIAFLGTDDFYLTTGWTPQRIPNSCKEWFFANANAGQLKNVSGWYDAVNSVIYWHFTSNASPSPAILDRYIAYNTRVGRWSTGYLNCAFVVPNSVSPSTPVLGASGGTSLAGYFFDEHSSLGTWDSAAGAVPGTMYVKGGYLGDETNLSELLRFRAKWNVYPTSDFGQAWHTNILGQTPIFDSLIVKGNDDWQNCRQYDRWHQIQISSLGPAELVAYAFEARVGGTR